MKKICIINTWIGVFPDNFPIWFESASMNPTIDFYIVTDQNTNRYHASNITFINMSLKGIKSKLEEKTGIRITLKTAYKLCDYKPLWSVLIGDKLADYDFWGHCDLDVVFGDIRRFITDELLEQYDRVFDCGYLIIYRNNEEMNELYRISNDKDNMAYPFKCVARTNWACYFDEYMGMSILVWKYKRPLIDQLTEKYIQDFDWKRLEFKSYITGKTFIFHWKNGKLYRIGVDEDGRIVGEEHPNYQCNEILLVHIQKRKMNISLDMNSKADLNDYWIYPNCYTKERPTEPLYTVEEKIAYADFIRQSDKRKQWQNMRRNGVLSYIPHFFRTRRIRKYIRSEKRFF